MTLILQFQNEQDKAHVEYVMGYGDETLFEEISALVKNYYNEDVLDDDFTFAVPPRFIRGFFYGRNYEFIYENPNFKPEKWD